MQTKNDAYSPERDELLLNKTVAWFVCVGASASLFDVMIRIGASCRSPNASVSSIEWVVASTLLPAWLVWVWQRLTALRRSRVWALMIMPLPIVMALGEYHGWSIPSRIIGAIAFGVVLLLLSLNPRGGDVPTGTTRPKEPPA
jgi:hypothetical protein